MHAARRRKEEKIETRIRVAENLLAWSVERLLSQIQGSSRATNLIG
jgi:hypothetical protein